MKNENLRKRVEISIILPESLKKKLMSMDWDQDIEKYLMNFFSSYWNAEKELVDKLFLFVSQKMISSDTKLEKSEKQLLGLDEIENNLKLLKIN